MDTAHHSQDRQDGDVRIILLATQPRMLREMLRRALEKTPEVQLVLEMDGPAKVPSLLERIQADWLVTTLTENDRLPDDVRNAISQHPSISVIGIAADGSHARITEAPDISDDHEREDFSIDDVSLADLLHVLSRNNVRRH